MLSSPNLSFSRTLPSSMFDQLRELLLQMAQAVGKAALVLTEAVLAPLLLPQEWQEQRFTIVVSEQFVALLVGSPVQQKDSTVDSATPLAQPQENATPQWFLSNHRRFSMHTMGTELNVSLTFQSETIATFILNLKEFFKPNSQTYQKLEYYSEVAVSNDGSLQSQFTLLLLEFFLNQRNRQITEFSSVYPHVSVCQPVEEALKKQIAQERLLNQVTTQIRKSLNLPVIVSTAVAQVREFLELDRLVVYKFEELIVKNQESRVDNQPSTDNHQPPSSISSSSYLPISSPPQHHNFYEKVGCIVYEVRANEAIPSVLNFKEENCFTQTTQCWEKYSQGFILVVNDIEKTYILEECLLNFFREAKVRAKLAAPIMFEDKLWGLLIAHQCNSPRHWTESEKNLLTSVAEQLAIAIHQADLMRSLTQEKQTLEERVIERTMALHDALVAAEAASRVRSEFLATISHELLTPLTYVIGMSSTLLRWSFGELTPRQRNYLQTIHDSGEHLLEMINDILELSQIEAGKAALNITEFSLTNIAESTINSLKDKSRTQRINLKLDLQINPQCERFSADARRLQQVLWNLLSNALKFTPEGGNVTLRIWVEDDNAVFQVEDTGIGIPEEQLSLLFEKFHQLDTPYRRRYGGTGLGLALTKQLVELHRGRIEVESTVGVGSVFTVWIPIQPTSVLKGESGG